MGSSKKGASREWVSPKDPDARIAKMEDDRTQLAYKAEHAVDGETGAVVAVNGAGADIGDIRWVQETLEQAVEHLQTVSEVTCETAGLEVPTNQRYSKLYCSCSMSIRSLRTVNNTCSRRARKSFSGAIEGRPVLE
jgi:hypothetical protein